MTQKYYIERLLPIYYEAINSIREINDKPCYCKKMVILLAG